MSDTLAHYGVKGMKWGQSKASSSSSGSGSSASGMSDDVKTVAKAQAKIATSGTGALSNKELQDVVTRINLERQYANLNPQKTNQGKALAGKMLGDIGGEVVGKSFRALGAYNKYKKDSAARAGTDVAIYNNVAAAQRQQEQRDLGKRLAKTIVMGAGTAAVKRYGPQIAQLAAKTLVGA